MSPPPHRSNFPPRRQSRGGAGSECRLGITVGDPAGIGPEIVARAVADGSLRALGQITVWAEASTFAQALQAAGLDPQLRGLDGIRLAPVDAGAVPTDFCLGKPSAFSGRAAAAAVRGAAAAALEGEIDAVVTAPLAKIALQAAGINHPGHTEFLAELAGVSEVAMMFVARDLRLTLATIHIALRDVANRVDQEGVVEKIRLTHECLVQRAGIAAPRIAVLGINPHAGEDGMFGDEEERVVRPAVEEARHRGWDVDGPFPADSYFLRSRHDYDAVIAMYHDQGLIPVKLLSEGIAINVTLGLPFLRTSVDHGTAFDIAGTGKASAASLVAAAQLAAAWA